MIQYLLQIPTQVIDKVPQDLKGMLIAAVIILAGAIVWLAIYIKNLHIRHLDIALKNTETMVKVTSDVTHAVENNTKATEHLNTTIRETLKKDR